MNTKLLHEWLAIDSSTGCEEAFLRRVEEDLAGRGLRIRRQPVERGRWNIHADPPGGPAEVLFSTHVDTVPPFFGPRVDDDGTIRARGACDTKGGLFAMLQAYDALSDDERARAGFLLVVGEEVDHIGAIVAARERYDRLKVILLCEPTQNRLATGQKGIVLARLSASGVAGHSAFPAVGPSAIHRLVKSLDRVLTHPWPCDSTLGDTTANIGRLHGGVAANIIAPEAHADILVRAAVSTDRLEDTLRTLAGDEVDVQVRSRNEPVALLAWPDRFATDVVPFNTDAPYLQACAPVVLVGPGDIRTAHGPDERIHPVEIAEGTALYRQLVEGILDGRLPLA